MSRYGVPAVAAADYEVMQAPYLGGNFEVLFSPEAGVLIGELSWDGSVATYRANPTAAIVGKGSGLPDPTGAIHTSEYSTGPLTGTFKYRCTFFDAYGRETLAGAESDSITVEARCVGLSWIPVGPTGTAGRKLYRSGDGGATWGWVHTINDNTSPYYVADNNTSPGAPPPAINYTRGGADLQCVAEYAVLSADDEPPVFRFAAKDDDLASLTGVATLSAPGYAFDQSKHFQPGYAVDLLPSVPGKGFTLISGPGVDPVEHVRGPAKVRLYQLPELGSYVSIGGTEDFNFNPKSREPKSMASGMNRAAWSVFGLTQEPDLSFTAKFISAGELPSRADGRRGTLMLVGVKDGQLTGDRAVFVGATLNLKYRHPAGDGASVAECRGKYRDVMYFRADG
jgi:hypothetical protein